MAVFNKFLNFYNTSVRSSCFNEKEEAENVDHSAAVIITLYSACEIRALHQKSKKNFIKVDLTPWDIVPLGQIFVEILAGYKTKGGYKTIHSFIHKGMNGLVTCHYLYFFTCDIMRL
jgi:hypothetical protein